MGNIKPYRYSLASFRKKTHKKITATLIFMTMKILVTGHRGFIGSQVFSTLQAQGYDVSGIDIGDQFADRKYDYIVLMSSKNSQKLKNLDLRVVVGGGALSSG